MARNFDEAHAAYASHDGARAKELSDAGKAAKREMERLNEEAAAWIFRGACELELGDLGGNRLMGVRRVAGREQHGE